MRRWILMAAAAGWIAGCAPQTSFPNGTAIDSALRPTGTAMPAAALTPVEPTMEPELPAMVLSSSAFLEGGEIPPIHTCDGDDTSPDLVWENIPQGTVSLALVFDDPDAGDWVHWVVYDLPPDGGGLSGGLRSELPAGGQMGSNTWGNRAYGGPCPPTGSHRYTFKLYALDSVLGLPPGATAEDLAAAAEGHVLGTAGLTGIYARR